MRDEAIRFLKCLSAANLCYFRIWAELFTWPAPPSLFFRRYAPPATWYYSAIFNVLILAVVLYVFAKKRWRLGFAMLACVIAKEVVFTALKVEAGLGGRVAVFLNSVPRSLLGAGLAVAVISFALLFLRWSPRVQAKFGSFLFAMSFLVPLTFGNAIFRASHDPVLGAPAARQPASAYVAARRAVWIIFDEMDERIAFSQRPAGLSLPNLDRFRSEAQVATQALSPSDATIVSIPSLLIGEHVRSDRPLSARRLEVTFAGSRRKGELGQVPDMFSKAREHRLRSGIAGWYVPYCRIFDSRVDDCIWWPMNRQINSYGFTLPQTLWNQPRSLFETSLYSMFGPSLAVLAHVRTVNEMIAEAAAMSARGDLNLVYCHFPVPHTPFVYDPTKRTLTSYTTHARGYLDNLQLADHIFSKLREAMERAGVWDQTAVLVTADHGFRQSAKLGYPAETRHVPWMIKWPGNREAGTIDSPFESVGTADVLLEFLTSGKIGAVDRIVSNQ
ncbi:MAG: sulfatase-like hydrolase/transferase [Bryobacterales bacterium]|nr:sulfatase-like hydrolase/transferase [Bryobacterales bacterium]